MLNVNYGEIRTRVIAKISECSDAMEENLRKLGEEVSMLPSYIEGDAAVAYVREFNDIVEDIHKKLNVNIKAYAEQLEDICKEFERLDNDMSQALG